MIAPDGKKLIGVPERTAVPFDHRNAKDVRGFIKLRLGHSKSGTVFVPEQVFIQEDGDFLFYQTSFFSPPFLGFNAEADVHFGLFNMDVGNARTTELTRIIVTVRSDELVKQYDDGAQLYQCSIEAPETFFDYNSGAARRLPDGDFALELFHITNPTAAQKIKESGEIWSSSWNLQGTRKLANVAYVYLTTLPSIHDDRDLSRIAMASDGAIYLQTTSKRRREIGLRLDVYRESTAGRTESLPVAIASAFVAPCHLLIHRTDEEAYYEVVGPEIFRIGMKPGTVLKYKAGIGSLDPRDSKHFSYIVIGDAAEIVGLAAPYDEEETEQVMHIERLADSDPFQFWLDHANSDQMTGRKFEPREFR